MWEWPGEENCANFWLHVPRTFFNRALVQNEERARSIVTRCVKLQQAIFAHTSLPMRWASRYVFTGKWPHIGAYQLSFS